MSIANSPLNNAANNAQTANIFDVSVLATLRRQAKAADAASNKAVAKQFEALFMQMVLKSMREATPQDGLFNSEQAQMYQSLLDQQLGQTLSSSHRGLGLAAVIEAQLARQNQYPQGFDQPLPLHPAATTLPLSRQGGLPVTHRIAALNALISRLGSGGVADAGQHEVSLPSLNVAPVLPQDLTPALNQGAPAMTQPQPSAKATSSTELKSAATAAQREFVQRLLPAALSAQQKTGIPAHFTVAHAALETGWGKSEPRGADGRQSFNLFGIKAGSGWRGASVEAVTTEVVAGVAQRRVERFRAYGSYAEAMNDYAQLLTNNPRYAGVLGAREPAQFAQGLQSAGFATDPNYASKLMSVIGGNTLRQAATG